MNKTIQPPSSIKPLLHQIGIIAEKHRMQAYAVGGCVRDWRLGIAETTDLDIAVEGDGVAVANAVAKALGGTVESHEPFGTATVTIQQSAISNQQAASAMRIDFATCRKETYKKPAAYPTVRPGTLKDDLARRDFTINAMAMAITPRRFGRLIDPFHGGEDLRKKRLRMLHAKSFHDDPSRILRGVRFAHRFGLQWGPQTLRAAKRAIAAGALGLLNRGRIRKELDRLCDEPDPAMCLTQLSKLLGVSHRQSSFDIRQSR